MKNTKKKDKTTKKKQYENSRGNIELIRDVLTLKTQEIKALNSIGSLRQPLKEKSQKETQK